MIDRENLTESILSFLRDKDTTVKLLEISKHLNIKSDSDDYLILKDVLAELVDNNVINKSTRRRYSLKTSDSDSMLTGTIRIEYGKGIVETSDPDFPVVTVKRNNLNTALDGDLVHIQLLALKRNRKPRAEVVKVLERTETAFAGTIEFDGSFYFLVPDDNKYYVDFLVSDAKLNNAKPGDKVLAKVHKWNDPKKNPEAVVTEILGSQGDITAEFSAIVKEFGIPEGFPDKVISEAEAYSIPENKPYDGRFDLREELIITIDPADARDFDDALSLKILENGNYYLGVHIADVSHYVQENSDLDIEARIRGNSTYLVDRVIPMLPEQLSNNVCSLNPNEPRFAYSVFMEITPTGDIKNYKIGESIIISKRRYAYEEVQDIIDSGIGDNAELILELHKVSRLLRSRRFQNGGIEFDTFEIRFVLNEQRQPVDTLMKKTTPATALVEEAMLAANRTVALHVENYKYYIKTPFIYRIHGEPDEAKIKDALRFVSNFGEKFKAKKVTSKEVNKLLDKFKYRPEKSIIHQVLIRSMQKAVYSHDNIGHYGLGFHYYTHFTSPIRRYPDLIVHRLLKEYEKERVKNERLKYINQFVKSIGNHCSNTERNSMEAERASSKLAFSILASEHIGEEFEGTVTGVTSFGIFVMLDDFYAEGLVHIKDLIDDYYIFDDKNLRLIGKRKKKIFSLGSKLRVKIINSNVDKRAIDLAYVSELKK